MVNDHFESFCWVRDALIISEQPDAIFPRNLGGSDAVPTTYVLPYSFGSFGLLVAAKTHPIIWFRFMQFFFPSFRLNPMFNFCGLVTIVLSFGEIQRQPLSLCKKMCGFRNEFVLSYCTEHCDTVLHVYKLSGHSYQQYVRNRANPREAPAKKRLWTPLRHEQEALERLSPSDMGCDAKGCSKWIPSLSGRGRDRVGQSHLAMGCYGSILSNQY